MKPLPSPFLLFSFIRIFLLLALLCQTTLGFFPKKPFLKWSYDIANSGTTSDLSFRKGNALVASSSTNQIFATTNDGTLVILTDGILTTVYKPEETENKVTECKSGVSLYENEDGEVVYAVYAVIDKPTEDAGTNVITSRVIAVNGDGSLRWVGNLGGYVAGTPIIGRDGNKIYVCQNSPRAGFYRGKIKIILDNDADAFFTASITDPLIEAPFGPLTVKTVNFDGKEHDAVYFSESRNDGYSDKSNLYVITPSDEYEFFEGRSNGAYTLKRVSTVEYSSVTRPTVSSDGSSVWLGGTGAALEGWVDIGNFITSWDLQEGLLESSWNRSIQKNKNDGEQPLLSTGILSPDDSFLYIAGASKKFYCLNAKKGVSEWVDTDGSGGFMTEAKYSQPSQSDLSIVYVVERLTGKVRQHDASTGERNWEFDCVDLTGDVNCEDSVEAEFTLSSDGNILYYGDIYGKVTAIQVAAFGIPFPTAETPTAMPSSLPSIAPSAQPSVLPTAAAPFSTPSHAPTFSFSSIPSNMPSSVPSVSFSFEPSIFPSSEPSFLPSSEPLVSHSSEPSFLPSSEPSIVPSPEPTETKSVKISPFSMDLFFAVSRRMSFESHGGRHLFEIDEQKLSQVVTTHLKDNYEKHSEYFSAVELELAPKGESTTEESIVVTNEFKGNVLFAGPSSSLMPSKDEIDLVTAAAFDGDAGTEFMSRLSSVDDPVLSSAQSMTVEKNNPLTVIVTESGPSVFNIAANEKQEEENNPSGGVNKTALGVVLTIVAFLVVVALIVGYERKKARDELAEKKRQWFRACEAAEEAALSQSPANFRQVSSVAEEESEIRAGSISFRIYDASTIEDSELETNPSSSGISTKKPRSRGDGSYQVIE